MATKNTKSSQKATTGAKVEKVTKVSKKAAGNVAATEKAGLKTKPGQGQKSAAAAKAGQKPAKATKGKAAPKGGQQGQRGRASDYPLETKVRAVGDVELRDGSFAQKISAMADKPITIGDLIEKATAKRGEFFRSSAAAESADAARRALTVRIRDLVRNEYLVTA